MGDSHQAPPSKKQGKGLAFLLRLLEWLQPLRGFISIPISPPASKVILKMVFLFFIWAIDDFSISQKV